MPLADRLYTAGHAFRRVERALNLVLSDKDYAGRITGWRLEKDGAHVKVELLTDRGNCIIRLPTSFQSIDAIRTAIVNRLRSPAGASLDEPDGNSKA
jgi:hypothetical protein